MGTRLFAESYAAGTRIGRATVRLFQVHAQVFLQRGTGSSRIDLPSSGGRNPPFVGRERSRDEDSMRGEARWRCNGERGSSARRQRGGGGGSERG